MKFNSGSAMLAVAALALGGCGSLELSRLNPWANSPELSRIPRDATVYDCAAGKKLLVRFLADRKSAMVIFPEREFRLDQVTSGSGVSYSNGRTTLRTQGEEAFLEDGKEQQFADCKKSAG